MASNHKKESEGIALLSIYGDEDDEMEDLEPQPEVLSNGTVLVEQTTTITMTTVVIEEEGEFSNSRVIRALDLPGNTNTTSPSIERQQQVLNENLTPTRVSNFGGSGSATATPPNSLALPQQHGRQRGRLAIVDYGHDEVAMSPEAEEGEIMGNDQLMHGEDYASTNGDLQERTVQVLTPGNQATPPQLSELNDQTETNVMHYPINESESVEPQEADMEADMVSTEEPKGTDPLDKFLPPPPKAKCSEELQVKIIKFLSLKKTTGRSFNSEVRNRKEYRNPDFLLHAVTFQDIDQIGSCFSKDVFDPHGYDKSDFYDEIEADMRRDMERKEQERKKSQKVDFMSGGMQPGTLIPTPKINIPIPVIPNVAGSGLNTNPAATGDTVTRDGRQNKKSKWDKVDGDQKTHLATGGQDSLSAVAAHTALLSAANAGSGYSAFAQQRRREAEDKRSSDKKLGRRS